MADGRLDVRVHPALVAAESWLANVNGVYNADVHSRRHGWAQYADWPWRRGLAHRQCGGGGHRRCGAQHSERQQWARAAAVIPGRTACTMCRCRTSRTWSCKYYLRFQVRGSARRVGGHCRHSGRACDQHRIGDPKRPWAWPGHPGVGGDDDPRGQERSVRKALQAIADAAHASRARRCASASEDMSEE